MLCTNKVLTTSSQMCLNGEVGIHIGPQMTELHLRWFCRQDLYYNLFSIIQTTSSQMCLNNGEVGIIIRHLQPSFMGVLCAMRSFSFACPYDVEQTLGKKCKVYPYLRNRRHVCVSIPYGNAFKIRTHNSQNAEEQDTTLWQNNSYKSITLTKVNA